jgi:hypothetical protein
MKGSVFSFYEEHKQIMALQRKENIHLIVIPYRTMRFTSDLHNNFNKYRKVLHLVNTVPVGKSGDGKENGQNQCFENQYNGGARYI